MYITFNSYTRKCEEIDLNESELVAGMTLIRKFWSNTAGWVTIPGASLYVVNADGDIELDRS